MKYAMVILALFVCCTSYAAGWTQFAVPTQVDIERGNGLMIYSSFGDPGDCVVDDRVYVRSTHPQYKEIYSAVLTAFSAGKQLQFYIHSCDTVIWYSAAPTNYNIMGTGGALNMKH